MTGRLYEAFLLRWRSATNRSPFQGFSKKSVWGLNRRADVLRGSPVELFGVAAGGYERVEVVDI